MLRRIAAYTLIVSGFTAIIFFRHYTGDLITHPWVILLAGGILCAGGFFLLLNSINSAAKLTRAKSQEFIDNLIANGEKIPVDLSNCEIHRHSTGEDIVSFFVFNYTNKLTGNTERFVSPWLSADKKALVFYFDLQQQTILYVDKTDRTQYYFDLDFIKG